MYDEMRMSVRSVCGEAKVFTVKVGVHTSLSPHLFSLIVDELTKNVQYETP